VKSRVVTDRCRMGGGVTSLDRALSERGARRRWTGKERGDLLAMNLMLIAVGRARRGPETELLRDYAGRLRWPLALREVEERRPLAVNDRRVREGRLLLQALPEDAHAVVLDGGGKALSSEALAAHLERVRDEGTRTVAFLIGGADGHDDAVLARANLMLSLGPMTWPHMLVRPMLVEQVFRAQCILEGHPYHRG